MIEGELEIGRALAQSPTGVRWSERWRRWREEHTSELKILLELRRDGVDLGTGNELFDEYYRRKSEAGTIWKLDQDPGS
jgi:hypothetical protein